jgi:large subunit ribosomal protein L6
MPRAIQIKGTVTAPEGVSVALDKGVFTVRGPKGEVSKRLHNPSIKAVVKGNEVTFSAGKKATLREKKLINTYKAHLRNMSKGVQEGHTYKLKVCSGHFPMTVSVKGDRFEVKNFIGEAVPRVLTLPEGVQVKVDGSEVVVEGVDKERVAQCAASIEALTRRPGFDARVFQDGIYITHKDGKDLS